MKPHRFDPLSLVAGLPTIATGMLFLFPGTPGDLIDWFLKAAPWVWPVLLLAVGLAVLVPLLARREAQTSDEETEG